MKVSITEWTGAPQMAPGSPMPDIHLVTGGCRTLLCAYMVLDPTIEEAKKEEFALVKFEGVSQFTFGYPNDEAISEHPLYSAGLNLYAFNDIRNSPDLRELEKRNSRRFPNSEHLFKNKKHYVVVFHDETLEVICDKIEFIGAVEGFTGDDAIRTWRSNQAG